MFIVNDDSKLIDKQIFIYLNQKILEVRERLNIGSTLARAEHAMHGGSELIDKAVEQLLLLFDKPDALTAEYSVSFFGRLIYYSYEKGMNPERLPLYFDQLILLYSKLLQIHRSMHLQETILNKFITDLPHFVKTSNNYSPAVGLALCEIAFLLERDPTAGWDKEASTVFSALFNTLNPSKTEKIKKLFWDASGLKYTNPDQAFDLLQEVANELSAESTEQDFYSRALTGMVEILYNKKDYKNAEILLEKALVAKQQLEDKQGLAILYFYRCQIYKDQALLSKAFESIDLALEFNKDIESEFGILLALKNKAEILFTTKDYSGAERCLREAIQYNDHFETRVQLLAEATVAAKMANESALQASSEVSLTKSISQNMDKVETLIEEIPKSSQKESELSSLIEERNGLIAAIYKNNLESQRE